MYLAGLFDLWPLDYVY